jgi:hypothetical protein
MCQYVFMQSWLLLKSCQVDSLWLLIYYLWSDQEGKFYVGLANINGNGTAVVVVCVTRRSNRPVNYPIGPGTVPVQDGYSACFCNPGTKLIEQDECRGTSLISG